MSFDKYASPFVDRYQDEELSYIWSIKNTRFLWRECWVKELSRNSQSFPQGFYDYAPWEYDLALHFEKITHHDVVAEIMAIQQTYPGISHLLHVGMTSSDVVDYATLKQIHQSLNVIKYELGILVKQLAERAYDLRFSSILGRTHLQPAEPTTWGYRLGVPAQQLLMALRNLDELRIPEEHLPRGAVGTRANHMFMSLLSGWNKNVLSTPEFRGQTYPRQYEYRISCILADVGATIYKLATDIRLLASWGEVYLKKEDGQIGSSAMPAKINPIAFENICSLARRLPGISRELWDVSANSLLERTLDDSALRRSLLPEMFLISARIIKSATKALDNITFRSLGPTYDKNWKAWLGSRIQTYLAVDKKQPIIQTRGAIDKALEKADRWTDFVENMAPDLLNDLGTDLPDYYFLGEAVAACSAELPRIIKEAEEICKRTS